MEIEEKPTLHRIPHHSIPFLLQHRTYSHLTRHNPSQNMSQNQLLQKSMKAHESTWKHHPVYKFHLMEAKNRIVVACTAPTTRTIHTPINRLKDPDTPTHRSGKRKRIRFYRDCTSTQDHSRTLLCWLNSLRQNMKHEVSPQSCWLWESKEGFLVWGWHDDERVFMLKRASIHFCHPILALSQRS